jgi:hypothetical protein
MRPEVSLLPTRQKNEQWQLQTDLSKYKIVVFCPKPTSRKPDVIQVQATQINER